MVGRVVGLLATLAAAILPAMAEETWHIKEAPIRFAVTLLNPPTHSSAGYFMHVPDGGILPTPFPVTQVVDVQGNLLKSYVLWQNPESGAAIVFEAPKSGQVVFVYVAPGARLNTWTPESGLTPSAIICTHPGRSSKNDAMNLASFGAVDATVHYCNEPGSKGATVALPGDRSGRPGFAAMYMLAYMATTDPGDTWFAPITFGGNMQVSVDGHAIQPHKINEKQGGAGEKLKLSEGLHRLDLLGFYTGAKDGAAEMLLTCRTPKTTVQELGGKRPADLRYPGTSMWEARQFHDREIVRSGECAIQRIQSRDGRPVAHFTLEPRHIYWFADETPVLIYTLEAFQAGNPETTQYIWSFSGDPGASVGGAKVSWFFPSLRDQRVTLKVVADNKQSQCTRPFYPFTEGRSSLENSIVRADFRNTCLTVFKSYPATKDPTAGWDKSMWNNFFRNVELTPRNDLISYMITNRWDVFSKKMSSEHKEMLEDMFLTTAAAADPKAALKWAVLLEQQATKKERAIALRLKGAEVLMYQLKNLDEARKWVKPLMAEPGEGGELAKIKMGDIEFLSRNLNEATQLYGDVQDRSKHTKTPAEMEAMKGPSATKKHGKNVKETSFKLPPSPSAKVAPWKLGAIRDVAAAENVRNLLDQNFNWEALQAMRAWEREFPLSKISSDYLLLEGKLCMTVNNYARCRALLEAYCDQVDASNYVEEALYMITDCMVYMKEPPEAVDKYRAAVRKRMEFR